MVEYLDKQGLSHMWENVKSYIVSMPVYTNSYDVSAIWGMATANGITSVNENPEWKIVVVDADDKIILGKKQDGIWFFSDTIDNIFDMLAEIFTENSSNLITN